MSHIFDALQRSEAERSGKELSSMELLELAELEATRKWDEELTVEPRKRSTPVEQETPFRVDKSLPVDATGELPAASRLAPADTSTSSFIPQAQAGFCWKSVRILPVTISPHPTRRPQRLIRR